MKKIGLGICMAFLLGGGLQAQTVVTKGNPLSLFLGTLNLQGEVVLSPKLSTQLGLFGGRVKLGKSNTGDPIRYTWLGVTPELRYYMAGNAPEGFYLGPFLRYRQIGTQFTAEVHDPVQDEQIIIDAGAALRVFSSGAIFGYQVITDSRFVLDFYAGPQLSYARVDLNAAAEEYEVPFPGIKFGGIGLRAGLALGYAF